MARKPRRGMPNAVSLDRIDALLGKGASQLPAAEPEASESSWATGLISPPAIQIERVIAPEAATIIFEGIRDILRRFANPETWELLPPKNIAFSVVNPERMRGILSAVPALADLPKEELSAVLRSHLPESAARPAVVKPQRFAVWLGITEGGAPARVHVNPGATLSTEAQAAISTLNAVTDLSLTRGDSCIQIGATTPQESGNQHYIQGIMTRGTKFFSGLGGVPVQQVSIFYQHENVRHPLY